MSLTCHFIDSNWKKKQIILNVKAMHGSQRDDLLRHWDIEIVMLVLRNSGLSSLKYPISALVPIHYSLF